MNVRLFQISSSFRETVMNVRQAIRCDDSNPLFGHQTGARSTVSTI